MTTSAESSSSPRSGGVAPRATVAWVNTTYFAEGLPYMIVRILSGVFFTQLGVKERYLGYLNYLGLPWNIKFLWAPLVDGWSSKKRWQVALQGLIGLLTAFIGYLSYSAATVGDPSTQLQVIAYVFVVVAFLAATNDIAIDGYYLEAIPKREDQALLSGYRVLAYRLAMVFARSGLVALAGWGVSSATLGTVYHAWALTFVVAGGVLLACAILHAAILPKIGNDERNIVGSQFHRARTVFVEGFATYIAQPQVHLILAFIILYKMGDELLFSMVTPFMLRELKVTTEQYAWIAGIIGAVGTIVGAMWGGAIIKKMGLRRAMWPLTIAMNANLWLYVWLSVAKPDPTTTSGVAIIATIHGFEQIAAGLGSAALLVFLLTTCAQNYKATHYAVGSAIMSIPGTLVGGQGGILVEAIGYTNLYILAFVVAIPGMCLIPFVPMKEE